MISSFPTRWRWLRHKWNRTRLAARLIGHDLPEEATETPGLIMIQIDGLSRRQLEAALAAGRMPYLSRLLRRRHFSLGSFYSGVPSTTPAVQGELFYGVKAAVPSFEFLDGQTGRMFRMYEAESASEIERRLVAEGAEPLLPGAHVYSNIYRAGAAESHYCSGDLCVEGFKRRLNPLKSLLLAIVYFPTLLRGIGLTLLELVIAIGDVIGGGFSFRDLRDELGFLPARVGICIAAREAIRFRVLLDITRGVPLIHANFLGYDEQAHRRGPDSDFAHWTLKGIDHAIRDIHRAAEGSPLVAYELLVYSDHGQEHVVPYDHLHGRTVEDAIAAVFSTGITAQRQMARRPRAERPRSREEGRRRLLHQRPGHAGFGTPEECAEKINITAMGPIGHIYLPLEMGDQDLGDYALALVRDAAIPFVLYTSKSDEEVIVRNRRGEWRLPRDQAEVFGGDHPFLEAVTEDIIRLSRHPNAGDFIIGGWDPEDALISFPREKGAHGGPGREETHGFVLVPDRIFHWHLAHHPSSGRWMRGTDLREVVRHYLGENGVRQEVVFGGREREKGRSLRVMTYNIHSCVGLDGRIRPERIARVINSFDPDLVAVQEVDAHRPRSGGHDQAKVIADHLKMDHAFYAVFEERAEKYGLAIFSRYPFEIVKTRHLTPAVPRRREARGAMWITFQEEGGGRRIHLINTHFGLNRDERLRQVSALLGPEWIGGIPEGEPIILCGDLNSRQRSTVWQRLSQRLRDVQHAVPGYVARPTFPTRHAIVRIDHLMVSRHFEVRRVEVPFTATALVASDHFPVCVELSPSEELSTNESSPLS
ncbi:MAG: endonuclease/exonuclease/phosphatase family protein [Verrucomicrobiales bacterium]|nr:endonuclease/exonuclease/phosphatase family protein [Verrucomicrobiales bacterium]